MRVEHIMTKDPVTCDVDDTVGDVAQLMRDKGVGCVIILRNGILAGVVTDRDLTVKALANGSKPDQPISRLLPRGSVHPAAVGVDDTIFHVIDTMRSGGVVRRLPVITPMGEVVGIVSVSDLAMIAKDLIDALLLEELHHSTKETRLLTGAKRFSKVLRRPTKAQIGRLPPQQPTQRVRQAGRARPTGKGRRRRSAGPAPGRGVTRSGARRAVSNVGRR